MRRAGAPGRARAPRSRRDREAQERGEFDALSGAGRPLALEPDGHIAEDLRLAYKILKNAECLPPEVELKKEIEKTEDLLAAMPEAWAAAQVVAELALLYCPAGQRADALPEIVWAERALE